MNEQLQKEIWNKVSVGWDAMISKLGITGQYAFEAAVRWQIGNAISMIVVSSLSIFAICWIMRKLYSLYEKSSEYSEIRIIYPLVAIVGGLICFVLIFCIQAAIPTLIAPDYAVIKPYWS